MSLESEVRTQLRMTALRRTILSTIQIAGMITVAAMAPNVLSLLKYSNKRQHERLMSAVKRLERAGYVHISPDGISLTPAGARLLESRVSRPVKPRKWDRKWRVVIFDIPEVRKSLRNRLRSTLQDVGFLKLQDSVWVYPYDCEDLVSLLKADFNIGKEVLYMIVDKLENDRPIKRHFMIT